MRKFKAYKKYPDGGKVSKNPVVKKTALVNTNNPTAVTPLKPSEYRAYEADADYIYNARNILNAAARKELGLKDTDVIPETYSMDYNKVNQALTGTPYSNYYQTLGRIKKFHDTTKLPIYDTKGGVMNNFWGTEEVDVPLEQTAYGPRHREATFFKTGQATKTYTPQEYASFAKSKNVAGYKNGGYIPKYKNGGFFKKAGEFGMNYLRALGDNALTTIGLDDVISDDQYTGAGANFARKASAISGSVGKAVLPAAMNMVVPGSGALAQAGQGVLSNVNNEYIQKPDEVNYNQDLTQTFGQNPYAQYQYAEGGNINSKTPIEVEGNELEVKNGKILKDFKNHPKHDSKTGGPQYNATPGNMIIPSKLVKKYKEGGKIDRNTIEANLRKEQMNREKEEQDIFNIFENGGAYYKEDYKNGGTIHIKPQNRGKFTAAAKRAGMGVQEYASHVLANKSKHSSTLIKRANFAKNASKWNHELGGEIERLNNTNIEIPTDKSRVNPVMAHGGDIPKNIYGVSTLTSPYVRGYKHGGGIPKYFKGSTIGGETSYVQYDDFGNPITADQQYGTNTNPPSIVNPLGQAQSLVNVSGRSASSPGSLSNSGSGSTSSSNLRQAGYYASMAAPIAYNLMQGTKKPQVLDPEKFQNPYEQEALSALRSRRIDMSPIRQRLNASRLAALQNAKVAGNTGAYLSNANQIAANYQNSLADAMMNEQNYNNQYKSDLATGLGNFGARRADINFNINKYNSMAQANRDKYLGEASTQISKLGQGTHGDNSRFNALNSYLKSKGDYQYNPLTGELEPIV